MINISPRQSRRQPASNHTAIWQTGRMFAGLLALLVVLGLSGYTLQTTAVAADNKNEYPYPGRLVRVDDHHLHLNCTGTGSPTVVVEAGSGSWSLQWSVVQEQLDDSTRVCTYDRAGYGWSEPGPEPRTGEQVVTELHTLLQNAGIEGPYVLVGHSLGGLYARLFAAQYPDEVAGMVLVDALHEEAPERMPPLAVQAQEMKLELYAPAMMAAQIGLLPRTVPALAEAPTGLPAKLHPIYDAYAYRPHLYRAIQNEGESLDMTLRQIEGAGSLGDLPLVVVRHGQPTMFSILLADDTQESEDVWRALQQELTRLSTNSRLVVASKSGHNVHLDEPALLVDVIREMLNDVRDA